MPSTANELLELILQKQDRLREEVLAEVRRVHERLDQQLVVCRQAHERISRVEARTNGADETATRTENRLWLLLREAAVLAIAAIAGWLASRLAGKP